MIRDYYVISVLIVLLSILWFVCAFERRKPKEREIVMLAVMTSMAIVGRLIFFMTPQFKPSIAVIIITGIMLGKQSGFLCGVLTAFVSDFFFGQGPWTPWQMIAFGLTGLLSAIIFSGKRQYLADNRWVISIYGFLVTIIIYGIIMDTASVFMTVELPTFTALTTAYMGGIIFNIIHGSSTFVFLWMLSQIIFKKIKRLKIKFKMFK